MNKTDEKMEKLKVLVTAGIEHIENNYEYYESNPELGKWYVSDIVGPMLKDVVKDLCREIENRHRLEESEGGKKIHVIHYTSIATLLSMLENAPMKGQDAPMARRTASLRLYDSAHFNDPDEGKYFYRNLKLVNGQELLRTSNAHHAYIASFIRPDTKKTERDESDDLVYWRTYGKEGEGCSLKLTVPSGLLWKVLYGTDEVKCTDQLLKSVWDTLYNYLKPFESIRGKPFIDAQDILAGIVADHLKGIRYLFKDKAYEYENEYRFVIPESDSVRKKICFESGGQYNAPSHIRHYYEVEDLKVHNIFGSGNIITLGPRVQFRNSVNYCLKALLDKAKLYGTEIKMSTIPYRKS